jgi:sugar porter (SP) family MFS transporter
MAHRAYAQGRSRVHEVKRRGSSPGRAVVWLSAITALGGLLFGYDTGVVSGALLFLKNDFPNITSVQKELVTGFLLAGAAMGAIGAGRVADRIGRQRTILITATLFMAGVLAAAFSPAFVFLLAAQVVIGLGVGSASVVVPMYIGEAAPPRFRGALVSFNQLALSTGILVSYLVDYGLSGTGNWRLMFGLACVPAAALFVGMLFQPESPAWLITHGRLADARRVLRRLRPADTVDSELASMMNGAPRQGARVRELLRPSLRPALLLGLLLAVFQQITGINTVIYYAPTLLNNAGLGSSAALLANVANGIVNVGMTIVAIRLLDRAGRRVLLISGTCGMATALLTIALIFLASGPQLSTAAAIAAVAALFVYIGSFAIGLGPVFWRRVPETKGLQLEDISAGRGRPVRGLRSWRGGRQRTDLAGSSRALAGRTQLLAVQHDPLRCSARRSGVGCGGRPDAVSVQRAEHGQGAQHRGRPAGAGPSGKRRGRAGRARHGRGRRGTGSAP